MLSVSSYPDDWDQRRRRVYRRDSYQCQQCGAKGGVFGDTELHAHHQVPVSSGGSHNMGNLTTVCHSCHERIHGHPIPTKHSSSSNIRDSSGSSTRNRQNHSHSEVDVSPWMAFVIPGPLFGLPFFILAAGTFGSASSFFTILGVVAWFVGAAWLGYKESHTDHPVLDKKSSDEIALFCPNCGRGITKGRVGDECPHCGGTSDNNDE